MRTISRRGSLKSTQGLETHSARLRFLCAENEKWRTRCVALRHARDDLVSSNSSGRVRGLGREVKAYRLEVEIYAVQSRAAFNMDE